MSIYYLHPCQFSAHSFYSFMFWSFLSVSYNFFWKTGSVYLLKINSVSSSCDVVSRYRYVIFHNFWFVRRKNFKHLLQQRKWEDVTATNEDENKRMLGWLQTQHFSVCFCPHICEDSYHPLAFNLPTIEFEDAAKISYQKTLNKMNERNFIGFIPFIANVGERECRNHLVN